ncbi:MAG: hypothetical protein Q7R95_06460 [bacterium]|nr:hypothetical protein [bacterium]
MKHIGIDVDSVLADSIPFLDDYHNKTYNSNITFKQHTEYNLKRLWNCTYDEVYDKCIAFYKSPYGMNIKPMKGAKKGINYLKNKYKLSVITSRSFEVEEISHTWLNKHFPNKFERIIHTNGVAKAGEPKKHKFEVCLEYGIELMVEDCLEFAIELSDKNIKTILLDMPWNQTQSLPKNITRIKSWKEIRELI